MYENFIAFIYESPLVKVAVPFFNNVIAQVGFNKCDPPVKFHDPNTSTLGWYSGIK